MSDREPAERLEALWAGSFGGQYSERNDAAGAGRQPFWNDLLSEFPVESVLEIGCNVGGNLQWVVGSVSGDAVVGIDVNRLALTRLGSRLPRVKHALGSANALPFADRSFELTFTAGVLIHQARETLSRSMDEIVRCSSRYVLCAEYFSEEEQEVVYRGHEGALFKCDYGRLYQERFQR